MNVFKCYALSSPQINDSVLIVRKKAKKIT